MCNGIRLNAIRKELYLVLNIKSKKSLKIRYWKHSWSKGSELVQTVSKSRLLAGFFSIFVGIIKESSTISCFLTAKTLIWSYTDSNWKQAVAELHPTLAKRYEIMSHNDNHTHRRKLPETFENRKILTKIQGFLWERVNDITFKIAKSYRLKRWIFDKNRITLTMVNKTKIFNYFLLDLKCHYTIF